MSQVTVVGHVLSINQENRYRVYVLDNGTSTLDAHFCSDSSTEQDEEDWYWPSRTYHFIVSLHYHYFGTVP